VFITIEVMPNGEVRIRQCATLGGKQVEPMIPINPKDDGGLELTIEGSIVESRVGIVD
jgi:hypothetical protein